MRIPDANLAEIYDRGYTIFEGFLDKQTLADAREAMFQVFPKPEDYFADPAKYEAYGKTQFAGIRNFPFPKWDINKITIYPDLIDAAERFLETKDVAVYKSELWAKYSGAINYDQMHHRDYNNHTLVVPRADGKYRQMTTFTLLSDVTEADGPTKILPRELTKDVGLGIGAYPMGEMFDKEISVTGPAGSLMIYKTDTFHRGSNFTGEGRSRFAVLTDFHARGTPWQGKMAWPNSAGMPEMAQALTRMTPRQRDLFGWPPPGSDYWNEQTLHDVGVRYPKMDLSPYRP
jgi:hypothetical protein